MFLLLVCHRYSLKMDMMKLDCIPRSSVNLNLYQNSRTTSNEIKVNIFLILGARCVFFNTFRRGEYQNDFFKLKALDCEDDSEVDSFMVNYSECLKSK